MPGPEVCDAITDPKEKADCLSYSGKYARQVNIGANPLGRGMNEIGFDEKSILNPMSKAKKTPSY